MTSERGLDAEELLHFALRASRRNDTADALMYVERALTLVPDDARLHLLQGGLYAEQGAIEPALEAMECAVALDRGLWGAHFQLGLLYSITDRVEDACRAWAPLDALAEDHPLRLFKSGLERLEEEDFEGCIALLEAGIAANTESEALNGNMRKVVEKARGRVRRP